jgi:hypothetical protein
MAKAMASETIPVPLLAAVKIRVLLHILVLLIMTKAVIRRRTPNSYYFRQSLKFIFSVKP